MYTFKVPALAAYPFAALSLAYWTPYHASANLFPGSSFPSKSLISSDWLALVPLTYLPSVSFLMFFLKADAASSCAFDFILSLLTEPLVKSTK